MKRLHDDLRENDGKVNGIVVNMRWINCDEDKATADQFEVEGYPTIKLVHGTRIVEYDAKPDLTVLHEFLNTTLDDK